MPLPSWADDLRPAWGGQRRKVATQAAWAFLGVCSLVLAPLAAELLGVPLFSWTLMQSGRGGRELLATEQEVLARDYVSRRPPPPGFERWVKFAKQNQCHLGPYERIEKDLQAFGWNITREQLAAVKRMRKVIVFSVKGGRLTVMGAGTEDEAAFAKKFTRLLRRFVRWLPDTEFAVNVMDEPRVLPGPDLTLEQRYAGAQCRGAGEDFRKFRHLHGSIVNRAEGPDYTPTDQLLPLFSQTKINECHADIQYPTLYGLDNLLTPRQEREVPAWEARNGTLFFRGTTTGGHYRKGVDYSRSHRHRLVALAKGRPHMDIGFTGFIQCSDVCAEMQARYGLSSFVHQMDTLGYKYLMSVDGNSFVSRLPLLMSSAGVPFRAGLYSEWFEEWVRDGEHYLHVKLDYSDLTERLDWARANDGEARLIGQRARAFALARLRNQDMECYAFRLLLEYAAILQQP